MPAPLRYAGFLVAALALCTVAPLPAQQPAQPKQPPSITSPDGKRAVVAKGNQLSVYDVQTQKEIIRMIGHQAPVSALGMSPDGKLLASGGEDGRINLWDMATGRQLLSLKVQATVTGLGISQDGKTLTSREAGTITKVWDVATGKLIKEEKKQ